MLMSDNKRQNREADVQKVVQKDVQKGLRGAAEMGREHKPPIPVGPDSAGSQTQTDSSLTLLKEITLTSPSSTKGIRQVSQAQDVFPC